MPHTFEVDDFSPPPVVDHIYVCTPRVFSYTFRSSKTEKQPPYKYRNGSTLSVAKRFAMFIFNVFVRIFYRHFETGTFYGSFSPPPPHTPTARFASAARIGRATGEQMENARRDGEVKFTKNSLKPFLFFFFLSSIKFKRERIKYSRREKNNR